MGTKSNWEKIGTSKRYLHTPLSGYFCTQWPGFKVILSKFETESAPMISHSGYLSSALCVLVGDQMECVDFRNTQMLTRDDGVPIHAMQTQLPKYTLKMENFCNTGTKRPGIFIRISVKNETDNPVSDVLSLLIRSGPENYFSSIHADGYVTHDDNVGNWSFAQSTWRYDGESRLEDDLNNCAMEIDGNEGFRLYWHGKVKGCVWHHRDLLKAEFNLQPGEEKSLTLRLHYRDEGETVADYETERQKAEAYWLNELKRIHNMPGKPEHEPMVKNMVVQLLQMFSSYLDEGYVAPRQGGMNRFFWSIEAMFFLEALDRLGDFDVYNRTAYDFFFDTCQVKEGEGAGEVILKTAWGSTTAGAMLACCHHILHRDPSAFERYKEQLYLAYQWIQRQRAKSTENGSKYTGIFPSMRGTDWPGEFQCWCMSDTYSQQALGRLAEVFETHDDPRAAEIKAAYEDYLAAMKNILAQVVKECTIDDELLIPNRLGIPQTDPPMGAYHADGPALLLGTGVMDPNSPEAKWSENYLRNRGCMQRGLTGLMCDGRLRPNRDSDSVAGHTWYLASGDMRWFYTWMAQGETEKAEQVIDAIIRYGVSDAYQMAERFADNDPYYMCWQPNASGNGRLISMLADYYGMRKV